MPILARMQVFRSLYIVEGPAVHFPVKATNAGQDIKDRLKTDVSLVIGVGVRRGRIGIEGRWDSGLRTIQKPPVAGQVDFPLRNRTLSGVIAWALK